MKKIILILLLLFSSIASAQKLSFPVYSIDLVKGYDSVFVLSSSDKMNSLSDRIYLDCQGFLSQLAFYNDQKNGQGSGPEEMYDLDHNYCEFMVSDIASKLEQELPVCIELNLESYEPPEILEVDCKLSL